MVRREGKLAHSRVLWAPGFTPATRSETIKLVANVDTLVSFRDGAMNAKLGEYAGLVRGFNDDDGYGPLMKSYALCQGLMRPIDAAARDDKVFAYVTNPDTSYAWPEAGKDHHAYQTGKPRKSVFLTYVQSIQDYASPPTWLTSEPAMVDAKGVVLYWEWVRPVTGDPLLPVFTDTRYVRRIW